MAEQVTAAAGGEARPAVLFLCTHNSARSQMAEGLLRWLAGVAIDVASAGTVATRVRPEAIAVMAELGVDIAGQTSKTLERYLGDRFAAVVTVCDDAGRTCPFFPGGERRIHWSIPDPSGVDGSDAERLAAFRAARDDLHARIETELLPLFVGSGRVD